jgi:hypothetical protein
MQWVAQGPVSKPPRLACIPTSAILLYNAQLLNTRWCLKTFQTMGKGATMCVQLFRFIGGIVDIAAKQQPFIDFLPATCPDWLPKLYDLQEIVRQCENEIIFNSTCIGALTASVGESSGDQMFVAILKKSVFELERGVMETSERMDQAIKEEDLLRTEQDDLEGRALMGMNHRLQEIGDELERTSEEYKRLYQHRSLVPVEGESSVGRLMADIRYQLLVQNHSAVEFTNQLRMMEHTIESNKIIRKALHRLPADSRVTAGVAGEARGYHLMASAKRLVLLKSANANVHIIPEDLRQAFNVLNLSERRLEKQAKSLLEDANIIRMKFERERVEILRGLEAADLKDKEIRIPTERELQEDRAEDEQEAKRDRARLTQYIPDSLLHLHSKTRLSPMVVVISRDVSLFARMKLHAELTRLLPGLFITLDVNAPYGIDQSAMQIALDSRCSMIMLADAGLTRLSRGNFMTRLELVVNGLYPVPTVVLALGDEGNRRGDGNDRDGVYGVHLHDLEVMKDGDIKGTLEAKARGVSEMLSNKQVYQRMQALSTEIWPPNPELALVLEALYVLQSHHTDDSYICQDRSNISTITWRLTSQLLAEPAQLASLLKSMRRGEYTLRRCETLLDYTLRSDWPRRGGSMRQMDQVLDLVSSYIEDWIVCERGTLERGGAPLPLLTKNARKMLQTVVWVGDSAVNDSDNNEATAIIGRTDYGWKIPAVRLVISALQDLRVLKTVAKIDGEMYNVTVHREKDLLYFDAYDPSSSKVYMTTVRSEDICSLLTPNKHARTLSPAVDILPPQSEKEMYSRLVKLLRFQKTSKNYETGQELTCQRAYTLLDTFTCRLSGHFVLLKCYEAKQGELFLTAFIYEYSALVSVLVDEPIRSALLQDLDLTLEQALVEDRETRQLTLLIRDRLRLWPRKSAYSTGVYNVSKTINDRQNSKNHVNVASVKKTQGFKLSVMTRGGAGRTLLTRVHEFNQVPHIVTVKCSSSARVLRICVYEPRKRHRMELRLSPFLRRVLLGSESDDARSWYGILISKLRVSWRGKPELILDTRVCRAVKRVDGRIMVLTLDVADEDSVVLTVNDTVLAASFYSVLSKLEVFGLMSFQPPLDLYGKQFKVDPKGIDRPVRNIMQGMIVDKGEKVKKSRERGEKKIKKGGGKDKKGKGAEKGKIKGRKDSLTKSDARASVSETEDDTSCVSDSDRSVGSESSLESLRTPLRIQDSSQRELVARYRSVFISSSSYFARQFLVSSSLSVILTSCPNSNITSK